MALNNLYCADVPLSNYSLTHAADSIKTFFFNILGKVAEVMLKIILIRD